MSKERITINGKKHILLSRNKPLATLGFLTLFATTTVQAAPGDLDLTFNGTGTVTTPIGTGNDFGRGIALQPDGKIIVTGYSDIGGYNDFAVVRYNNDGSLDTAFGHHGVVVTPIGSFSDYGRDVVLQPDGKIVVVGYKRSTSEPSDFTVGSDNDFAVARYHSDGSLDTSFGHGGIVTTAIGIGNDNAAAVVLQPDGKIVVVGYSNTGDDSVYTGGRNDVAVARYNSDGSLDTTFNSAGPKPGTVTTFIGSDDLGLNVALQADGKIVVAGRSVGAGIAVLRYNSDGSLDTTFNSAGIEATMSHTGAIPGTTTLSFSDDPSSDYALSVVLQPDGKIVVAGFSTQFGDIIVARYHGDGSLDTTFNSAGTKPGTVITPVGIGDDYSFAMTLQTDGKIVVVGKGFNGLGYAVVAIRYLSEGRLDTDFGSNGIVVTSVNNSCDICFISFDGDSGYAVALQPDGKIVVAGDSYNGTDYDFAVVRYNVAASPSAASNLQATAISSTQVDLNWTDNSDNETGFKIFRNGIELTPSPAVAANATSLSDTGLTCNTTYTYDVTATNASGDSTAITATATTLPCALYTLTTSTTGTGTVAGAGSYAAGTLVTLSATPNVGFTLAGWTPTPCAASFTMPANDLACTATFVAKPVEPTQPTDVTVPPVVKPEPVTISTSESVVTESNCPPKTRLEAPCDVNFQTVSNLEVTERGYLTNAIVTGTLTNRGWVANLIVQAGATVSGGTVTGRVENKGTVSDFEFRGSSIVGGTLAGKIINRKAGGVFQDVQLAAGTHITGGRLSGEIAGDCADPAKLSQVRLLKGSHLSCVILGDGVVLEDGVTVDGLEESADLPTLGEAKATDATGKSVKVNSQLRGGIAPLNGTDYQTQMTLVVAVDAIDVAGEITVDPEHVGQVADLFVYAIYQETVDSEAIYLMRDNTGAIFLWNQQVADLVPFQTAVQLTAKEKLTLYQGIFLGKGALKLFFGYRLPDGSLVQNGEPIAVTIE